jgi:hypothetical protein
MRYGTVIRLSLAILPVAIATACGDNRIVGVGSGDHSSLGAGGTESGIGGSGTNSQGSAAADTFSLVVHVTVPSTTADTLHGTPVAGATATLTKTEWTFIKGNGADTMSGHTVTVGHANTDANGDARFDKLPPDLYRATVTGPTGSGLDAATATLELLHVANGFLPITLKPIR